MTMTDPFAAVVWAVVSGLWLSWAVYACLMSRHYRGDAFLAALAWMFLSLSVGTAMIGLLRTGWGIIPLSTLKVIERTAFVVAAVDGYFVMQIATGRWETNDTMRKALTWWNHMLGGVV